MFVFSVKSRPNDPVSSINKNKYKYKYKYINFNNRISLRKSVGLRSTVALLQYRTRPGTLVVPVSSQLTRFAHPGNPNQSIFNFFLLNQTGNRVHSIFGPYFALTNHRCQSMSFFPTLTNIFSTKEINR